jgi:hypothetical protein
MLRRRNLKVSEEKGEHFTSLLGGSFERSKLTTTLLAVDSRTNQPVHPDVNPIRGSHFLYTYQVQQ